MTGWLYQDFVNHKESNLMGSRTKKSRGNGRENRDKAILHDRRAAFAKVLDGPIAEGQGWLHAHEPGAPVVVQNRVTVDDGTVMFPLPLPSELLLKEAEVHLIRAARLRQRLFESAHVVNELHLEHKAVSNHDLTFDFFQEAMTGIMLVYAAISNFANEHIPRDFQMEFKGQIRNRNYFITCGTELRLSKVLHEATGKPNLKSDRPELWDEILHLKELREAIEHADGGMESVKLGPAVDDSIFAQLLNEPDLVGFIDQVRGVIDMYRDPEQGPQAIECLGVKFKVVPAR